MNLGIKSLSTLRLREEQSVSSEFESMTQASQGVSWSLPVKVSNRCEGDADMDYFNGTWHAESSTQHHQNKD